MLYNLLNCPAGVVSVSKVTTEDVNKLKSYRGHYGDPWDEKIKIVSISYLYKLNKYY